MKTTKIILLAMLISFGLTTMAQVAINTDGSDANASSVLHVKGNSTNKYIIIEPGVTGGVGIGVTSPNTFLHINSPSDQDPFRIQIDGNSKLFTLNNGGTGIGDYTVSLPANGLYVFGSVGIGINSPHPSAKLEISSTSQGFLPPLMSNEQMNTIASPATGLMVFNTSLKSPFFYDGSVWKKMYNNDGESCGTITYDGQTYETVIIGNQCWMTENLNIGLAIVGSANQTDNGTIEKYCYDNNTANCDIYGGIYQWNEMMQYVITEGTQGICPTGWHLPTDDEWKTMEMYLGMSQSEANGTSYRGTDEGGKMKETGTTHWSSPNTGATNTSGFTALPGGGRSSSGSFGSLGNYGYWWSSSEYSGTLEWGRHLSYNYDQVNRSYDSNANGFSVRCLKN